MRDMRTDFDAVMSDLRTQGDSQLRQLNSQSSMYSWHVTLLYVQVLVLWVLIIGLLFMNKDGVVVLWRLMLRRDVTAVADLPVS